MEEKSHWQKLKYDLDDHAITMKVDHRKLMNVYANICKRGCSSDGHGVVEAVRREGIGYDNTFVVVEVLEKHGATEVEFGEDAEFVDTAFAAKETWKEIEGNSESQTSNLYDILQLPQR